MKNIEQRYYRHLSRTDWNKMRSLDNAQNRQLTENQHRALSLIAYMRHEFHCSIAGIADNKNCERYKSFFMEFLPVMLRTSGLPKMNIAEAAKANGYNDFEELFDDNKKRGDSYLKMNIRRAEWLNGIIEDYLRNIDASFDTWYAPSGSTRNNR